MALPTAAQDDEQSFSIPGQDGDDDNPTVGADTGGFGPTGSPQPQTPSTAQPSATATPSTQPKVSGRALFLGNLLKTVLSGIQNAPGNPRNAFDRGFMANSPQNQQAIQTQQAQAQANVQKTLTDADAEKVQTSLTAMKALQYEYLLKRMPQDEQNKHLEQIDAFKTNLIKEGAEVVAEGDDEKAADAQAFKLNGSDERATKSAGRFYSLPTINSDGTAKFDVVYVPTKDVLQHDWTSPDGKITLQAGMPMGAAFGKVVETLNKDAQDQTKSDHQAMAKALSPNVPDAEVNQTIAWLESQQKQNTALYQQNKTAVDAQINTLKTAHQANQADRENTARAGAQIKQDVKDEDADKQEAKNIDKAVKFADSYIGSKTYTGAGDFALTEQFLEAVKVSKGFRMGSAQFDRIDKGRSLVDGARARWDSGVKGTLFGPEQRQQVVDTMHMMQQAKTGGGAAPTRPKNVPANAVWDSGARQWRLPQ